MQIESFRVSLIIKGRSVSRKEGRAAENPYHLQIVGRKERENGPGVTF